MYYIKYFIVFSILGFIMESTFYKVCGSSSNSGVLYGPWTLVYGLGGICIYILNKSISNLNINNFYKLMLMFILFTIVCTLVEYIIGNLIYYIFSIDKWNYLKHPYHFGKYICLDKSLTWGFLAIMITKIINPFIENLINIFSNKYCIILLLIIIFDLVISLWTKAYK